MLQQFQDAGVVLMHVRRGLRARRYAVAGDQGAVKDLEGREHRRNDDLGVAAIEVRVVQQALRHAVIDVDHLRQVGIGVIVLADVAPAVEFALEILHQEAQLRQVLRQLKAGQADDFFVFVGIDVILLLDDHAQVAQLGIHVVLRSRAAHVDEPFLEADDGACGGHHAALQTIRNTLAAFLHILVEGSGESLAVGLCSRLDDVFDRKDPRG